MITLWQAWCILAVLLILFEIFAPAMFFINLALGCIPAAIAAYYGLETTYQIVIFGAFSGLFLWALRPVLLKRQKEKEDAFKAKYVGQEAKALMRITRTEGRISVFGEEWEARACYADEDIPEGRMVQIKKIEGMTMYVDNFIDYTNLDYKLLSSEGPLKGYGLIDEREDLD